MKTGTQQKQNKVKQSKKQNQLLKFQNINKNNTFVNILSHKTTIANLNQKQLYANSSVNKKFNDHIKQNKPTVQSDQTEKYLCESLTKLQSSQQNLNNFYKKSQSYKLRKQKLQFEIINKQLKSTNKKLKNKNFKSSNESSATEYNKFLQINQNQQFQLSQKLVLIQRLVNKHEYNEFKQAINEKVKFLKKKYKQNQDLKRKIIKYYTSYEILQRFLKQIVKNTQKMQIKQQNIQLYYKIKQSMVSVLVDQQYFLKHINNIEQLQQKRQKSILIKNLHNQEKFILKSNANTKINRFLSNNSDNQKNLCQKIEELLQISKNNIKEAFINFNKPHLMYQIQLQFNKRFTGLNNHLMVN